MESITSIATKVTTLIFPKFLEKGSEQLEQIIFNKIRNLLKKPFVDSPQKVRLEIRKLSRISELLNLVREKFQKEGVEGKLIKAQEDPNDENKLEFKRELIEQMENDEVFVSKLLQELVGVSQESRFGNIEEEFHIFLDDDYESVKIWEGSVSPLQFKRLHYFPSKFKFKGFHRRDYFGPSHNWYSFRPKGTHGSGGGVND